MQLRSCEQAESRFRPWVFRAPLEQHYPLEMNNFAHLIEERKTFIIEAKE